jgi:hypothetical protein
MGNSVSSGRTHDETVDFGALVPQGVYTGPRDWAHQAVAQAIVDRRLAPFYRPLEDYEDGWTDEQILAARKEPPLPPDTDDPEGSAAPAPPARSHTHASSIRSHGKKASTAGKGKEQATLNEASLYRGAVECPICFLVRASSHAPRAHVLSAMCSITRPTSTTPAAVPRPCAPSALCRSSGLSRTRSISSPSRRRARTACAQTLASSTSRRHGERASAVRGM